MKPKLLFHSNAGWTSTGYGQQTGLFSVLLSGEYDVTISAYYGLEGAPLQLNESIRVLPGRGRSFGNEYIRDHARHVFDGDLRGGLVLTLMDVWVLDPNIWGQLNVCSWVPVDHEPAPEHVKDFFRRSGSIPIAMSRFGAEQLAEFDPLYVPHAIDTSAYAPMDQSEAREAFGFDKDSFMVGVVAANKGNPSRKCFPEMLEAFAAFYGRHPDAKLYLHTETTGKVDGGVNLLNLIDALGLPEKAVVVSDQYRMTYDPFSPQMMSGLFSAFDVLLSTSRGEGFGITPLEAQACGTPVIVSDFSAQPEVCGSGWMVGGKREWSQQQSWQFLPDVEEITEALEDAYSTSTAERERLATEAREHALTYDARKVAEQYMLPALEKVSERIDARKPMRVAA